MDSFGCIIHDFQVYCKGRGTFCRDLRRTERMWQELYSTENNLSQTLDKNRFLWYDICICMAKPCEKMGEYTPVCCGRYGNQSRSKTHRQDVSGQMLSPKITRRRFYGRPGRGYRLLYQPQPTNFISMEYGISVCTPYALQVCLFASETVRDLIFFRRFRYLYAYLYCYYTSFRRKYSS